MKQRVALLTGGKDPHYALGLLSGLLKQELCVDFICNDEMEKSSILSHPLVRTYNLRGDQDPKASLREKAIRVLRYYYLLIRYAWQSDAQLFHILWLNRFTFLDSTLLNTGYRLLGKKLVFTAHNIDIGERDNSGSPLQRFALGVLYRSVDHIFVHTELMKRQLLNRFGVPDSRVTVIPFGVNDVIPTTNLTREEARDRLGIGVGERVVLFFGNIAPYKGLEFLVSAVGKLARQGLACRLLIAGRVKFTDGYWRMVQERIKDEGICDATLTDIDYIPDERIEVYFKSADLLVIPYRHIFQSGVLFLSYHFGVPVVGTDVGSLAEAIVEGKTGLVCRREDADDMAEKIAMYFRSTMFADLEETRRKIIEYAHESHSWEAVGEKTSKVYADTLQASRRA